ncbi:30S ribosomal protein S20 [Enterococcus sp. 669A]|uniref:Small ribosomal subunit protein bS20 n=1 Tax=Candidatus Enterococcus moelleringii TaxID=2815325 RepID=A0ABS3LBM9_9ENTE|nr:30S ribosomal protein S20 [Enterococcus sp. 669A]MBO1307040.1 30S ribosomal protein S20 [Enterococcus sp. 669A]
MPNIESAIKRVRTNENASAKNASQMSAMRTTVKKFDEAVAAGAENINELHKAAVKAIDMAESKGLIHKNKASRDKARLARELAK